MLQINAVNKKEKRLRTFITEACPKDRAHNACPADSAACPALKRRRTAACGSVSALFKVLWHLSAFFNCLSFAFKIRRALEQTAATTRNNIVSD